MAIEFDFKDNYNIDDLIHIVDILRKPGGCPWDIEQTHESIKKSLIEETYEVIEAINKSNNDSLKEELGDVLLQVVFHAQIENENGAFNFDDVADGICKKLILRHPHVFGDVSANTSDEVLTNWDAIKLKEKGMANVSDSMVSVPKELPSLMRAYKVQKKAAKQGFDFPEINDATDKLYEEINELKQALAQGSATNIEEEFGDVLFSCVNISRFAGVEPEEALTKATDKFIDRYILVEKSAKENNIDMKSASLDELDTLWNKAKNILSE